MKKYFVLVMVAFAFFITGFFVSKASGRTEQAGYILEHESNLAREESGPHNGEGKTTAYSFFNNAINSKLVFRKRILHKGASIGYHLQNEEEIYYIEHGEGEMVINNKAFKVTAGDAILTLAGSSHGLKQAGNNELAVIINYEK